MFAIRAFDIYGLISSGYTPEEIELALQACQIEGSTSGLNSYLLRAKSEFESLKQIVDCFFMENNMEKIQMPDTFNKKGPKLRQPNFPVGLQNMSTICYFNSLLQFLYHNEAIVSAVFKYNVQKANEQYVNLICSLQRLFANLWISNKSFADPTEVFQFLCWDKQDAKKIGYQQDFREFFEVVMEKIDKTLSYYDEKAGLQQNSSLQKKFCYKTPLLQDQFEISWAGQKQNQTIIDGQLKFENIYCSLFEEFKKDKVEKLPQNLLISISRYSYNKYDQEVVKLNNKFTIHKEIFVDFVYKDIQEVNQLFQLFQNGTKIDGQSIQQQLSSFSTIIKFYEQEKNQQMVTQLTKDYQVLQNLQTNVNVKGNLKWLGEELSKTCKFKYYLQSVVVHKGQAEFGHYFIYIYNFHQKKWFRINDNDIKETQDAEVFEDALENAYVVNYVSEEQKAILYKNEEIKQLIQGQELNENLREYINALQQIPEDVFKQILKENEKTIKK